MDVNAHATAVDVADLKKQSFVQSEAAGVNGSEIGFVLNRTDRIDDFPDFVYTQYRRQPLFPFSMNELQGMPVTLEDIDEKELDAAVADAHGGG